FRNERYIATLVLVAVALASVVLIWRIATVESTQGSHMLAMVLSYGAYYASVFRDKRVVPWKLWLRTTLEVSAGTLTIALDSSAGADYLVTSSAAYIYLLAVVISCLRLDTRISLYAAVLAIAQQLGLYLYLLLIRSPDFQYSGLGFSRARIFQELLFRSGILAIMGALGMLLTRTLKREIARAVEEARVRAAFGSYVDSRVVNRVLAGDLKIAPERRPITVLFVDIRNFTRLSETSDPVALFEMLNEALDAFAGIVQREGGLVNKFLGDGLMAIFGAPEPQVDHPRRAVRAALNMCEAAKTRRQNGRFPGLTIGIGIHTGDTMVGDIGGARREYTAIGDVVNVASRVEAANKELGTELLVTGAVVELLGADADLRPTKRVTLRGREKSIDLFELRGMDVNFELSGEQSVFEPEVR
ncbi:MAG: adenylate/guanylate cyclase domain-containing protein, partial [Polyangiaceae bacterium]